ncbi:MAG: NAD(P)/FAD-dependent oxidoreductase [Actinomycetota bacterium]
MVESEYDVIVVGGGPAGAAAARAAVGGGFNTLLIEKKRMPRHKPCSGYIFTEAGEFLDENYGPIPEEVKAEPQHVRGQRLYFGEGKNLDVPIEGISVWRDRFDQWLCQSSGAEIWDGAPLIDFAEWSDRVELVVGDGDERRQLKASAMIAADGALSGVAGRIDPTFTEGVPYIVTRHEYHIGGADLEPGIFHVFLDAEYGVYPAVCFKDDFVVIDTSVRRGRKLGPVRDAFHAMLGMEFGFRSRELSRDMGCSVVFPSARNRFCLGTGRVLVAGEAAGFMNALGEGISSALATGHMAGMAAAESGGKTPGDLYREKVKPERKRTAMEWSLPALMMGRAKPEFRQTLTSLQPLDIIRLTRAILAWQRSGGVAPGLEKEYMEVALRRLLHGDYDFRA